MCASSSPRTEWRLLSAAGLLWLASNFAPSFATTHCHQKYPLEMLSTIGKVLIRPDICGETVHIEDLRTPPNIIAHGIDPNGTYALFMLKNNGRHDMTYSIMWHLQFIKPFGESLTRNQSMPPVVISYEPPKTSASYDILVLKFNTSQHLDSSSFNISLHNITSFNPSEWLANHKSWEIAQLSHTNFTTADTMHHTVPPPYHTPPPPYHPSLPPLYHSTPPRPVLHPQEMPTPGHPPSHHHHPQPSHPQNTTQPSLYGHQHDFHNYTYTTQTNSNQTYHNHTYSKPVHQKSSAVKSLATLPLLIVTVLHVLSRPFLS